MASSLASIAETWPENVLPQWQQKNAYAKNKARPNNKTLGPDGIFCTKCNFLQVLDLLIFRQKQPCYWAEVVCHFHLLYILFYLVFVFDIRNVRCKVTKSKFGTVRICQFLSAFVSFCQFSEQCLVSRCKVTKSKFGTVSLCQSMSLCVTLCHFPIYCLFLDAKLRKVNLALSAFVRICPEMSAFVRISFSLQSYKIENWQCPNLSIFVHFCPFNYEQFHLSLKKYAKS